MRKRHRKRIKYSTKCDEIKDKKKFTSKLTFIKKMRQLNL